MKRWLSTLRLLIPLGLWIVHLFLPVLERTNPKPGWVQIYLIFWPLAWVSLISHVFLFAALGLSAFWLWGKALGASLLSIAFLLLIPLGPLSYPGVQSLWASQLVTLFTVTFGFFQEKRFDRKAREH